MSDARPIVFLHLPKTGGQSIHHALTRIVGASHVSPIRLMSQAPDGQNFPSGYRMHSGHLDWSELAQVPDNPFSFMVLRDPRERLGSFYFFMREEARAAAAARGEAALPPVQRALLHSPAALFFSDDPQVQNPVMGRWWNATVTYLALRRLYRRSPQRKIPAAQMIRRALASASTLSALYRFGDFVPLEDDIEAVLGARPSIADRRANAGPLDARQSRWDALCALFDRDAERRALEDFVALDLEVMDKVTLRTSAT